jgi:hypothetical protein
MTNVGSEPAGTRRSTVCPLRKIPLQCSTIAASHYSCFPPFLQVPLAHPVSVCALRTLDARLRCVLPPCFPRGVAHVFVSHALSLILCHRRPCLHVHFASPTIIVYMLLQVYLDFNVTYILISGWALQPFVLLSHPGLLIITGVVRRMAKLSPYIMFPESLGSPTLVSCCIGYEANEFRLMIHSNDGMRKGFSFSVSRPMGRIR